VKKGGPSKKSCGNGVKSCLKVRNSIDGEDSAGTENAQGGPWGIHWGWSLRTLDCKDLFSVS